MLIIIIIMLTIFRKRVQEVVLNREKVVLIFIARWEGVFEENIKNVREPDEQIQKMWYINKMEYYSGGKKNVRDFFLQQNWGAKVHPGSVPQGSSER